MMLEIYANMISQEGFFFHLSKAVWVIVGIKSKKKTTVKQFLKAKHMHPCCGRKFLFSSGKRNLVLA